MNVVRFTQCAACLALAAPAFAADDKITLSYNERPPYIVPAADGTASGLTASPAADAFKAAGIELSWSKVPSNRQLAVIKEGGPNCAIGWYKTAEREGFAKFSKPIYRDKPTVLVAGAAFGGKQGDKLADVMEGKGVRVLVKEHFSYGPFIDGMLEKHQAVLTKSNGTPTQMLQLVSAKMVDFMFASEEEAEYLVAQSGINAKTFKQLQMADIPGGDYRYIMCSKQVPDELMARLNKAIAARKPAVK